MGRVLLILGVDGDGHTNSLGERMSKSTVKRSLGIGSCLAAFGLFGGAVMWLFANLLLSTDLSIIYFAGLFQIVSPMLFATSGILYLQNSGYAKLTLHSAVWLVLNILIGCYAFSQLIVHSA